MKIIKNIFYFLLAIVGIAAAIGISYIGGYIVRWFVWLICFICEIFLGENFIITWIGTHDTAMHIICSFTVIPILILGILSEGTGNTSSAGSHHSQRNTYSYEDDLRDSRERSFCFVDVSGAYRRWGDSFIDHKGNWCSWGSGFYDYDDNYIRWGGTYKDSSGAYRRWGDDFVDAAGNYVRIP